MSDTVEIERKFLAASMPQRSYSSSRSILQTYIAVTDTLEIRLRDQKDKRTLTIKSRGDAERLEIERSLSDKEFDDLYDFHIGQIINKRRLEFPLDGELTAELDLYHGDLSPLRVVEVEFSSTSAANAFTPPAWFGKDITERRDYKNVSLALNGLPDDHVPFRSNWTLEQFEQLSGSTSH